MYKCLVLCFRTTWWREEWRRDLRVHQRNLDGCKAPFPQPPQSGAFRSTTKIRAQVYLIQGCLSHVHQASSKGLEVPAGSTLHLMHVRLWMTVQLGFGLCQAKLLTQISFLERASGPIRTSPIRTARTLRTACPSPSMSAELLVSQHQCCLL